MAKEKKAVAAGFWQLIKPQLQSLQFSIISLNSFFLPAFQETVVLVFKGHRNLYKQPRSGGLPDSSNRVPRGWETPTAAGLGNTAIFPGQKTRYNMENWQITCQVHQGASSSSGD